MPGLCSHPIRGILGQAVKANIGQPVFQRCLARDEDAAGNVVAPFDLPVRLQRGYYLCAPRGRAHPALDHFREGLLDIAAKDPDVIGSSPHYSQDELNNQ